MKYIFTIHSPITFLIAYDIIHKEQLPENDVIMISSSNYKPPIQLDYIRKSFQDVNKSLIKKVQTWNVPKAYDKYINNLTKGESYIAYIDMMHMYQRLLITNENCKGFHFIEEGSASYVRSDSLNLLTRVYRTMPYRYNRFRDFAVGIKFILRGYSLRTLALPYWPENYRYFKNMQFYCLSSEAYPGIDDHNKVVVEFDNKSEILQKMAKNLSFENQFIWIEDSFTNTYRMSSHLYKEAVLSTLNYLKSKNESLKVYLKLRPSQSLNDSIVYEVLSDKDCQVEVLNNDLIVEALLANSHNCTVIGNVSSILFYATLLDHKSISMFDRLKNKPKTAFDDFDTYWKNIIKI